MAEGLSHLITPPGAFVLLLALAVAGILVAFNLRLSQLVRPMTSTARPPWANTTRDGRSSVGALSCTRTMRMSSSSPRAYTTRGMTAQ